MDLTVIALIAAVPALLVLVIVWSVRRDRARAEEIRSRAAALGFTYREKDGIPADGATALPLFQRGRKQRTQHVMNRTDRDIETLLFDYAYTTGSGKHQHTHRQTVALFRLPDVDLPKFEISPENMFHRLAGVFGYQDIDFDASPEFSKAYVVRGVDEVRVRAILGPSARHLLERQSGWSTEGGGPLLAIYRSGKRVSAEDLTTFLEDAKKIRQAITSR